MKTITWVLATVVSLIGLISALFGGYAYIDERYALASEQTKLEKRLTVFELRSLYRTVLQDLYFHRDQLRKYPDDEKLKEKVERLEEEVKDLKEQIKRGTE